MGGLRVTDTRAGIRLAVYVACILGGLVLVLLILNRPAPLRLPYDWPVPALQPPAGAVGAQRPGGPRQAGRVSRAGSRGEVARKECWDVSFSGSFSWAQVVEHTESALLSLGYELRESQDRASASGTQSLSYVSPDKCTVVTVSHFAGVQTVMYEAYDFFTYEVIVYY